MKTKTPLLALALAATLSLTLSADDKNLLKKAQAAPNVMVIVSNTDSMKYMPYLQGTTPNLPWDGQYGDSPLSKFGLAKAAFNKVVQTNAGKFNFGLSWYSYHQETVSRKHWSYRLSLNITVPGATSDFGPNNTFSENIGVGPNASYEEWGTDGRGPIASTTGGAETFVWNSSTPGTNSWFGDKARAASCTTDTCVGYAVQKIDNNSRVIASIIPTTTNGQPYGDLVVYVEKQYQTGIKLGSGTVWSNAQDPGKFTPNGYVKLAYVPAAGTAALPNVYASNANDAGKYMGFMRGQIGGGNSNGDWNLNSDCGGWFVQNDLPAIDIPRDYWSDAPACKIVTCSVQPQDSYGCVLRYTRPQSVTIHYDQSGNSASPYQPTIVPDPTGTSCSNALISPSLTSAADQVVLLTDQDSHIPESKMFANVKLFFTGQYNNKGPECWGNGARIDDPNANDPDPNKRCRSSAVILLSDTFDACGGSCLQNPSVTGVLKDLANMKVPVYVISFGDLDNGSTTAREAHCIARTSGAETSDGKRIGTFFITGTDPQQVSLQLQNAFTAILSRIDEAVEDFASATVSSVQAGNGQMAFLATFNGRQSRSIWDGAIRGYVLQNNGAINPDNNLNPTDSSPCVVTITDPIDPQANRTLTAPCSDPQILKWNAEMNLAYTPLSADGNGVADLTPNQDITKSNYSDNSNTAPHTIPRFSYPGRRIVWSIPNSFLSGTMSKTLQFPLNGADNEKVPEATLPLLNSVSQPWWPWLRALLTPQAPDGAPPAAGTQPCDPAAAPCLIGDDDARQAIRFIRGDRDSVITELNSALKLGLPPPNPSGANDAHYYGIGNGGNLMLGDIFHSNPQLLGEPENFFYYNANLHAADGHGYVDFFNKYGHRRRILYAGANDGLLHAFDVGVWGRDSSACTDGTSNCYDFGTGAELFAYAPRSVMQNYKRLKDAVGAQQPTDEWTVDGAPSAADVYIDTSHSGTPVAANRRWHTVIVGSQREGSPFEGLTTAYSKDCVFNGTTTAFQNNASSVFALDVTTPEPIDSNGKETTGTFKSPGCLDGGTGCPSAWPTVLWEFQDPTIDAAGNVNMGESWSKPGLGRICVAWSSGNCSDERYVALFGGGFDRTRTNSRGAWFYIVDIETGSVLYKIGNGNSSFGTVGFGSIPSEPTAVDVNGDGFLDVVYFGDLKGQMWRLNLTDVMLPSSAPNGRFVSKLTKADGTALSPFLVFQADQPTSPAVHPFYPIYYRPAVVTMGMGASGSAKLGLAFGTGDRDDVGATCPTPASNVTRTISYNQRYFFVIDDPTTTTLKEKDLDQVPQTGLLTPTSTHGWYYKLGATTSMAGERVITNSLVASKYIYFFTSVPASLGTSGSCPPPSTCSSSTVPYEYVMYYLNGNPVDGHSRGTLVPDASFATDPIFYISGNNQGNVGFTTNHGTFQAGKTQSSTRGTLKNWKEN